MAHPQVLVDKDPERNERWYTVNGRHIPFTIAEEPLRDEGLEPGWPCAFNEEAPPDHPRWAEFMENPAGYEDFKKRQAFRERDEPHSR